MNIQLTQKEIEAAVRQYVAGQGISVQGKIMAIKFTTTRSPSGIVAEITLEDQTLAAVDTDVHETIDNIKTDKVPQPLTAVPNTVGAVIVGAVTETKEPAIQEPDVAAAVANPEPETTVPAAEVVAAPAATTNTASLFG